MNGFACGPVLSGAWVRRLASGPAVCGGEVTDALEGVVGWPGGGFGRFMSVLVVVVYR
jgi:hypothetical protein